MKIQHIFIFKFLAKYRGRILFMDKMYLILKTHKSIIHGGEPLEV